MAVYVMMKFRKKIIVMLPDYIMMHSVIQQFTINTNIYIVSYSVVFDYNFVTADQWMKGNNEVRQAE